jgi:putative ABC transport system permease protein
MDQMSQAQEEVDALLRKRHKITDPAEEAFMIRSQADIVAMAEETNRVFTLLLASIASVSLIVGGIGIMNIMLVSVTERTREIGIRIAIGARRRDIRAQFLVEALLLSLAGGSIGVILGVIASFFMGKFSQWEATVSPLSILVAFGFAAFVGVFFGYYPARQASRLNPIDALRYE